MKSALDGVIVVAAAALLLIAALGGVDVDIGGLSIRIHDWLRPALSLALGLIVRASLSSVGAGARRPSLSAAISYVAMAGLLALLIAAGGAYLRYHVRVAGGLDSYGYVSTAALIASGRLSETQPLAAVLPFPDALNAATPLGHVPSADGRSSVPRFPIGLPMMMALVSMLHPAAPFFVPLLMACATLVLVYAIARAFSDRLTGLLAAALVAVDPVFAVSAIQPMSDVPATCWLVAAIWAVQSLERSHSVAWSAASGICAGMAVLTRPVLLPAALVLVLANAIRARSHGAIACATVVAVSLLLQLSLNISLYGTATLSGYGTASHMFELSPARVTANVSNFGKWLTHSRTAPLWLLWPAALIVVRRERRMWELSAIAVAAAGPYLFYLVFDNWDSLRFLLPAIVLATIVCAHAGADLLGRSARSRMWRPIIFLAIALGCATGSQKFLRAEGVERMRTEEGKYALVGEWFRINTGERAVVLASLHSGAIRLYGKRPTIRWDQIPPDALEATIERLVAAGYEPYLALDVPSEPSAFEDRFRGASIEPEPIARVRVVNIYKFMSAR